MFTAALLVIVLQLGTTRMPSNRTMALPTAVHSCNGIVLSIKKEQTADTCNHVHQSLKHHAVRRQPDTGVFTAWVHLYKTPEKANLIHSGSLSIGHCPECGEGTKGEGPWGNVLGTWKLLCGGFGYVDFVISPCCTAKICAFQCIWGLSEKIQP